LIRPFYDFISLLQVTTFLIKFVWFRCKPKEKHRTYQLYLSLQSFRQHCGIYYLRTTDVRELQYKCAFCQRKTRLHS